MAVRGQANEEELKQAEDSMYKYLKPQRYGGKKGLIIKMDKEFEENCFNLQQKGMVSPKTSTVLEFYQACETLSKQNIPRNGTKHKGHRSRTR